MPRLGPAHSVAKISGPICIAEMIKGRTLEKAGGTGITRVGVGCPGLDRELGASVLAELHRGRGQGGVPQPWRVEAARAARPEERGTAGDGGVTAGPGGLHGRETHRGSRQGRAVWSGG